MKLIITPRTMLYLVIYIMLIFAEPLEKFSPVFVYVDDMVGLIGWGILILLVIFNRGKVNLYYKKVIIILFIILCIGMVSNIVSGIERSITDILTDVLHLIKFMGAFILADYLTSEKNERVNYIEAIEGITKITIIVAIIFWILHFIFNIGMSSEVRFGIKDYKFIYANSGAFANYCIMYYLALSFNSTNKNSLYKAGVVFLLLTTLRFKSFGVVGVILILWLSKAVKQTRGIKYIQFIVAGLVAAIIGWDQLSYYYLDNNSTPRELLLKYGIQTANAFFPLGSGFGTYGSNVAASDYSPLYIQYGFSNLWALGYDGGYLNDNFWPMICAQYGWIGLVLYIVMIVILFKILIEKTQLHIESRYSIMVLFANISIASLGGPIMVGIYAVIFFFLAAALINSEDR